MAYRCNSVAVMLLVGAAGCTFGSGSASLPADGDPPAGDDVNAMDDGANTSEGGTPLPGTTSGAAEETTDGSPDTGARDGTTTDGTTTGEPAEGAVLVFADAPTFEFGPVAFAEPAPQLLTLHNDGDVAAVGIQPILDSSFTFVGGDYPGAGGSCGDTLEARGDCTVEVIPAPVELGLAAGTLSMDHADGSASIELTADINTGELVVNRSFEDCDGFVVASWEDTAVGSWYCDGPADGITPQDGDYMAIADAGPDNQEFRLRQSIDLSGYSAEIDAGGFMVSLSAWATALDDGDDEYRISLRYFAAGDEFLESYNSGFQTGAGWTEYTDVRAAPDGTREVRVRLGCRKQAGFQCNAYFDDISVVGSVR